MTLIELNSEQKIIQSEIKKFAQAELDPISADIDKKAEFPHQVITKLSELGFLGAIIPDSYDGAGLDTTSLCVILEELARVSASVATVIAVHNCFVVYPLLLSGNEPVKDAYLSKLACGTIGACALRTKLDVYKKVDVKTTDGKLIVSGTSDFVLNSEQAGVFTLPITVDGKPRLIVFTAPEDFTREPYDMLGLRSAGIARILFPDTDIPKENVLGNKSKDTPVFTRTSAYGDIGFAAISLGIAESCLEAGIAYAKERKQFNRAICEFPMVREMLVDMKTRIDAARLLVFEAAKKCDQCTNFTVAAHNARLFSDETAVFAGTTSVQIHGGYGYIKDYPVERFFRDAKSIQVIGNSPHEIKEQIAEEILL